MMPVKSKINKSAEVRKLHASGVTSASELVEKLKARGIKVSPQQVYQVLAKMRKGRKKGPRTAAAANGKANVLDNAIVFVRSAGGMQNAKELLAKLSQLQN